MTVHDRPFAVPPAVLFELVCRELKLAAIAGHRFNEHEPHTRLTGCGRLRLHSQGVGSLLDTFVQLLVDSQVVEHITLGVFALAILHVLRYQRRQELLVAMRARGVPLVHGAPLLLHVLGKLPETGAIALRAAALVDR